MVPGVVQSHTATQQWQSFEMRMRRRRIERCLLRASVAIEAGVLDDAVGALEEVQRLDPYEPELESLRTQLSAAAARPLPLDPAPIAESPTLVLRSEIAAADIPTPDEAGARRHWREAGRYAAAALLIAMSGAGGWLWSSTRTASNPAIVQSSATPSATSERTAPASEVPREAMVRLSETPVIATAASEPAVAAITPVATGGSPPPGPEVVPAAAAERPAAAVASVASPTAATDPAPAAIAPPKVLTAPTPEVVPERPRPVAVLPEPAPAPAEPAPAAPVAVAGANGVALSDTAVNLAATAAVPSAPPAAPPSQTAERQVRAVLSRYENAYSSLDAAAAHAVWPGVDRRALSNAFQGLSAQSVSLERCDISVSGATAQAECKGTAQWTPKVGGGPQTAARQWRFDLRNTGTDWMITRATVR
jgi:hypothetical protein